VVSIDILHLIDRLEEALGQGRRLPWGQKLLVDGQRLFDLIDQLRVAVPAQVREAREILAKREEVLAQAREEAQNLIARAQAEVDWLLSDNAIVQAAEERSRQIVEEAERRASEMLRQAEAQAAARLDEAAQHARQQMADADRYALETLRRLEAQISQFLNVIHSGIASLEGRR